MKTITTLCLCGCRKFWKLEEGRLDKCSAEVKAGRIPDFGASLIY